MTADEDALAYESLIGITDKNIKDATVREEIHKWLGNLIYDGGKVPKQYKDRLLNMLDEVFKDIVEKRKQE